jgi:hypothetical protein
MKRRVSSHPSNRDTRALLRKCEDAGLVTEHRPGGHFFIRCPLGIVTIAATPSDSRAHKNNLARLRQKGARL